MRIVLTAGLCMALASAALAEPRTPSGGDSTRSGAERVAGRTLPEWAGQLESGNRVVRLRAAATLSAFGIEAVPALTGALSHADPAVRYWAAYGLGTVAPDREPRSREEPSAADPFEPAIEPLRNMLDEKSVGVRMASAFALCRLGRLDEGLPHLTRALEHPERGVSNTAADLLARVGPPARSAIPALEMAIERNQRGRPGGDYHIAGMAREAIRRIRDETAAAGSASPE
jgi:HEAT repeats